MAGKYEFSLIKYIILAKLNFYRKMHHFLQIFRYYATVLISATHNIIQ